jgi:PadR family transcriptional regulator, regulatory protein PadR
MEAINREMLLGLWKLRILQHAGAGTVHGPWVLTEMRRHGYEISPGTLYPLLNRMERLGWLRGRAVPRGGRRARQDYRLTAEGKKVLELMRGQVRELYREVVVGERKGAKL